LLVCASEGEPVVLRRPLTEITVKIRGNNCSFNVHGAVQYTYYCTVRSIQECLLDHLLARWQSRRGLHFQVVQQYSNCWARHSPNKWRALPENMLYFLVKRQIFTCRASADCNHWPGSENLMGDVPSRSFEEGFPEGTDNMFLEAFAHQFPLPASFPRISVSQPSSWRIVTLPEGIVSATISLLYGTPDTRLWVWYSMDNNQDPFFARLPLDHSGKENSIVDPHLRD